jgi:hypothetical protein
MCWKWCSRAIVSKHWIKQLHTLPVVHFNRCLTAEYSETTAHFNAYFDTDKHIDFPNAMYISGLVTVRMCLVLSVCLSVCPPPLSLSLSLSLSTYSEWTNVHENLFSHNDPQYWPFHLNHPLYPRNMVHFRYIIVNTINQIFFSQTTILYN